MAEFVRTYQSLAFPGKSLVRKLEAEKKRDDTELVSWKALPTTGAVIASEEIWLRHFPISMAIADTTIRIQEYFF